MSNEYGYGVVDSENNPVQIAERGIISFSDINEARVYIEMINATPNLNEAKKTPWRPVKLTWSELDE